MRNVYVLADNIFSPLGGNTRTNMDALRQGTDLVSGSIRPDYLQIHSMRRFFLRKKNSAGTDMTSFEQVVFSSAMNAIQDVQMDMSDKKTGFILSTTKGNISLIEDRAGEEIPVNRVSLNTSAGLIAKQLGLISEPLVVSHACISGLLAMITGMRLIQAGIYDQPDRIAAAT